MVVQGKDDLCGIMKVLNWGVCWEEMVSDEEHTFQEGPELDCPVATRALDVLVEPDT